MEHFSKIFTEKPELVDELFKHHVSITLKVDGTAFQIVHNDETNDIEYHKRSGDSTKIGPVIDDLSKLLVKRYTTAIKDFDSKKELLDDYKFLAIEIFDKKYVLLTAVVTDNDKVIDTPDSLKEIADKLGIDTVPVLFEGTLSDVQKDGLKTMMTLAPETTTEEYAKYLTDLFGEKEYTEFLKGSGEIEGIVLTFEIGEKVAQYKIINPAFKTRHDAELKQMKEQQLKLADLVEKILTLYMNKLNPEKLDDRKLYSLDKNFLKIMDDSKFANKVMNVAAKFPNETNPLLGLDLNICSPEMKKFLKRLGKTMEVAYKQFVMTFYKPRKRNYIVSKEFQMKINEIADKM